MWRPVLLNAKWIFAFKFFHSKNFRCSKALIALIFIIIQKPGYVNVLHVSCFQVRVLTKVDSAIKLVLMLKYQKFSFREFKYATASASTQLHRHRSQLPAWSTNVKSEAWVNAAHVFTVISKFKCNLNNDSVKRLITKQYFVLKIAA